MGDLFRHTVLYSSKWYEKYTHTYSIPKIAHIWEIGFNYVHEHYVIEIINESWITVWTISHYNPNLI